MTDLGIIRKEVDARIAELEVILDPLRAEYEQLRRLAATFDGATPPPSAGAAPVGRAQEALALIGAQPGITASDLAAAMGISRNYLYRVLPKLERRGVIRKQGRGYQPAQG